MIEKKITLSGTDDIKLLCDSAVDCSFDIDILSGNYIIDAKSFMGIFSLDQREMLVVRANADEPITNEFFHRIRSLVRA